MIELGFIPKPAARSHVHCEIEDGLLLSMNLAQTNPPLTPPRRGTGQLVRSLPGRGWGWVNGPNAFEKKKEGSPGTGGLVSRL